MSDGDESQKQTDPVSGATGESEKAQISFGGYILVALGGLILWSSVFALRRGHRLLQAIGSSASSNSSDDLRSIESANRSPENTGRTPCNNCAPGNMERLRSNYPIIYPNQGVATSAGVLPVVSAFSLAMLAGFGFLFAYWTNQSNAILGTTLAVFFAGLGITLVLWSHRLIIQYEIIEKREPLNPAEPERDKSARDFDSSKDQIARRGILKSMCAAAVGMTAFIGVSLLRSLGPSPESELNSTVWKRGQRLVGLDGRPVSIHSLQPGSTTIVFPEGRVGDKRAQTVLLRVPLELLQLPQDRKQWAPSGNLAYSRVCTHAGCAVGIYETTAHLLMCPCHQSTFDVLRAAKPTSGPAARPLPQLPLYADAEGYLRAGGGFSEPPGPEFWGMR